MWALQPADAGWKSRAAAARLESRGTDVLIRNNQELFLIKRRDTAAQPGYTVLVAGSHGMLEDRVRSEAEGAGVITTGQGCKRSPLCEQNQPTPSTRSCCGAQGWELRPPSQDGFFHKGSAAELQTGC